MNRKTKWNNIQVKKLFLSVEKAKEKNESLMDVFKDFAKKTGRMPNSVRNFYYKQINDFEHNQDKAKQYGVDLSKHEVVVSKKFSGEETKNLVKEILRRKCLGMSVRKACLELSNGNISKMVRLQNKFRSTILYNKNLYDNCMAELKEEGLSEAKRNVVFMKKQDEKKQLTDEEVNSLFLGLIKLVKKTAVENFEKQLYEQSEENQSTVGKFVSKLTIAEKTVEDLRNKLEIANNTIKNYQEENMQLKIKIAHYMSEKIIKTNKNKTLAKYLREMKESGTELKTKI